MDSVCVREICHRQREDLGLGVRCGNASNSLTIKSNLSYRHEGSEYSFVKTFLS